MREIGETGGDSMDVYALGGWKKEREKERQGMK